MRLRRLALLLALLLMMPAGLAEEEAVAPDGEYAAEDTGDYGLAADLSGGYVPSADMQTADITIGYVAAAGASMSPALCTEWGLVSVNQLIFESVVDLDASMQPVPLLADSWEQDG